jgi:hypothetical protein
MNANASKSEIKQILDKKTEPKFLPYSLVHKYEALAEKYNISRGARGLEKPTTSDEGFVRVYERVKDPKKLEKIPVKMSHPNGANWLQTRNNRVRAKLGQLNKMKINWFGSDGLPTKMHTILIMWGYSPYSNVISKLKI